MIPIYEAAHSMDAHLVKNLLAQAGITSHVRGEYLQGGLGDLPVSGLISVCVAEPDVIRARRIVTDWDRSTPAAEPVDDDTDADIPGNDVDCSDTTTVRLTGSRTRLMSGFIVGALLASGVTWLMLLTPELGAEIDYNEDGNVDERIFYNGSVVNRVETDRNRDGSVDSFFHYDRNGVVIRSESDDDFDGRMERQDRYLQGLWVESEFDRNGDGAVDYRSYAVSGVLSQEVWLDANGRVIKKIVYQAAWPSYVDIDTDGDGQLDTRRHFDERSEVVRTESLPSNP